MVRVLKEPEERKSEIMDAAWELFNKKGYEQTSINDIIQEVKIAKGTFYYYFKSKEEILDSVLEREIGNQVESVQPIIKDNSINAIEKIKRLLIADKKIHMENSEFLDYLHKKENIIMHQKSLLLIIKKFSPIISEIIKQGIEEDLFNTNFPLELSEYFLTGMSFLLDPSLFSWTMEERNSRISALQDILETALRCEKGSFSFLLDISNRVPTNNIE